METATPAKSARKQVKITNRRTGRPIPDPDTIEHEGDVKDMTESIDTTPLGDVESAFINSQPSKEPIMSFDAPEDHSGYAETATPAKSARKQVKITNRRTGRPLPDRRTGRPIPDPDTIEHEGDVESAFINSQPSKEPIISFDAPEDHSGYAETINPLPKHEPTKQELKAAAALEKIAAKAAKKEAAELAKAEKAAAKLAAIQTKNHSTKEEREAAKLERQARLEALDLEGKRKYHGSMLALADRVKQGVYVKGATGQLRSTNELANLLDAVPVTNVIQLAKIVLELPENPYTNLNSGQQSMNLRNRMRGAIKKGTLTLDTIRECIEENGFATATDWAAEAEAKRAARAASAAAAKAAKEAKAAAKAEAAAE